MHALSTRCPCLVLDSMVSAAGGWLHSVHSAAQCSTQECALSAQCFGVSGSRVLSAFSHTCVVKMCVYMSVYVCGKLSTQCDGSPCQDTRLVHMRSIRCDHLSPLNTHVHTHLYTCTHTRAHTHMHTRTNAPDRATRDTLVLI